MGQGLFPAPLPFVPSPGYANRVNLDSQQLTDDLRGTFRGVLHFDTLTRGLYATDASPFEVQPLAVAVEELPEPGGRAEPVGVRVGDVVGQRGHALAHTSKGATANSRIDCRRRTG